MSRQKVLASFDALNVWRRGDERAPNKPLLVLYALGRWVRGEPDRVSFREARSSISTLLKEFGRPRKSYHPEYPFWYLQSDGVWDVEAPDNLRYRKGKVQPTSTELTEKDVHAGFSQAVLRELSRHPELVWEIADRVLHEHFPESIHSDILSAVGLSSGRSSKTRAKRDPGFRAKVMTAYEYSCAVCGFDVQLDDSLVALEAAHIKWHQAKGPDIVPNGLALCTLHHKTFDLGAYTVQPDLVVLVSERVRGSKGLKETLLDFHGGRIRAPQHPDSLPQKEFLDWHRKEVFRGQPRYLDSRSS